MRRRRRTARAALLVVLTGVALGACSPEADDGFVVPQVGPAELDVGTPELRRLKAEIGIEPCAPGSGSNDLPAVTLPCLGGGPDVALDTLEGPLVVTVWAQWCAPCREELPILQRFARAYDGRVGVLGIDFTDQYPREALGLLRETGATFPQLADFDEQIITGRPPFPSLVTLPMLALVDADGGVRVHTERITTYEQLAGLVEQHLGVPA